MKRCMKNNMNHNIGTIDEEESEDGANAQTKDENENDIKITPARRRLLKIRCRSSILTPQELTSLQDVQHHIALKDAQFSDNTILHIAEKEERDRHLKVGVKALQKKMIATAKNARSSGSGDSALGVLSSIESLENSLYVNRHDTIFSRQVSIMNQVLNQQSFDCEDCSYVRKPNLSKLLEKDNEKRKISWKNLLTSRRFHLYKHRFANCQYNRTLLYPTLPQPSNEHTNGKGGEGVGLCTEIQRTRSSHRFIIAADTQFGILMDGFAMENPNWGSEIEISRRAVKTINDMKGSERPLFVFVCVCGDLVDTESSFSQAMASWKKIMGGWERHLVFEQQVKDFKHVWSKLDEDIALVCLCGNHDVGNRPTAQSIQNWTSQFGNDYLAFWVNGTYNIGLNNNLFSDPTGAPDLFKEQLEWLEERLIYAQKNNASHIFIHSHFPWFLVHEKETDEEISSFSHAPEGWGPRGTSFPDSYFTIPIEYRQMAMLLFEEYGVTACFSGHFHQNVVTKASWGMDMIVTGPLSMTLRTTSPEVFAEEEAHGVGMRLVDVQKEGFTHTFLHLA